MPLLDPHKHEDKILFRDFACITTFVSFRICDIHILIIFCSARSSSQNALGGRLEKRLEETQTHILNLTYKFGSVAKTESYCAVLCTAIVYSAK